MVAVQVTHRGQNRAEALLRLRSADGQLESAAFLLDACVEFGLTRFIDHWVLEHSLRFLDANHQALRGLEFLSINVLPSSLNDELFLHDVLVLLRAYPHAAARLCLEITEVGAVYNFLGVKDFIAQAQALGVKIALDDFGAGFSNYQYAIDLDLDLIKIDGGIISTLCQSKASRAVVASIVKLAEDLGCECVAEWVEDLPTLNALRALNVPYVQGHLLAPALDPSAFFNAPQCLASTLCANLQLAS
jgi:EAL domain-containing protein (putative c-di-GMP-specific phosphodiesterase class I)